MNYLKQLIKRFFHIHDYSKWVEVNRGNLLVGGSSTRICGKYFDYSRECKTCGWTQSKRKEL